MSKMREEAQVLINGTLGPDGLTVREAFPSVQKQAKRVLILLDKLESMAIEHRKWGNYILADEIAKALKQAEEV